MEAIVFRIVSLIVIFGVFSGAGSTSSSNEQPRDLGQQVSPPTAQGQPAAASVPDLVQMKPAEVIAGRRAAFYLSGALFSDLGIAAKSGQDVKDQSFSAHMLVNWARVLPHMFPDGSNVPPTHANPNVWSDRAGFEAKAKAYEDAAGKLAEFADANDKAGFAQQISVVKNACSDCHQTYHRREKTSDGK
jgi:cytochrome c556